MKHLLKIPQKKSKCNVSYLDKPVKFVLTEVKIKNFIGNNIVECHIPVINNKMALSIIEDIDNNSYETLKENPEWIEENNLDNIYTYSYSNDISCLNVLLNNKTECYMNGIESDLEDTIELLKDTRKTKDYNINMELSFLGLFIYETNVINKWVIKNIDIQDITDDINDWNREEIEEDWENEINNFEIEIYNKIENYKNALSTAKNLLNEVKEEENFNNWEKKILKLKKYILKL